LIEKFVEGVEKGLGYQRNQDNQSGQMEELRVPENLANQEHSLEQQQLSGESLYSEILLEDEMRTPAKPVERDEPPHAVPFQGNRPIPEAPPVERDEPPHAVPFQGNKPIPEAPPVEGKNPIPEAPPVEGKNPIPEAPPVEGKNPIPEAPPVEGNKPIPEAPPVEGNKPVPEAPPVEGNKPVPESLVEENKPAPPAHHKSFWGKIKEKLWHKKAAQ